MWLFPLCFSGRMWEKELYPQHSLHFYMHKPFALFVLDVFGSLEGHIRLHLFLVIGSIAVCHNRTLLHWFVVLTDSDICVGTILTLQMVPLINMATETLVRNLKSHAESGNSVNIHKYKFLSTRVHIGFFDYFRAFNNIIHVCFAGVSAASRWM